MHNLEKIGCGRESCTGSEFQIVETSGSNVVIASEGSCNCGAFYCDGAGTLYYWDEESEQEVYITVDMTVGDPVTSYTTL